MLYALCFLLVCFCHVSCRFCFVSSILCWRLQFVCSVLLTKWTACFSSTLATHASSTGSHIGHRSWDPLERCVLLRRLVLSLWHIWCLILPTSASQSGCIVYGHLCSFAWQLLRCCCPHDLNFSRQCPVESGSASAVQVNSPRRYCRKQTSFREYFLPDQDQQSCDCILSSIVDEWIRPRICCNEAGRLFASWNRRCIEAPCFPVCIPVATNHCRLASWGTTAASKVFDLKSSTRRAVRWFFCYLFTKHSKLVFLVNLQPISNSNKEQWSRFLWHLAAFPPNNTKCRNYCTVFMVRMWSSLVVFTSMPWRNSSRIFDKADAAFSPYWRV